MFNHLKWRAVFLLLVLVTAAFSTSAQSGNTGLVRFFHGIPGAAAVDIYTNGQLTVTNLAFGQSTGYISIPAGENRVVVTPTGVTTALWEQQITLNSGQAFTLVVSSFTPPVAFSGFEDVLDPLALGKARFSVVHAIADAPTVDILLDDGRPVLQDISYNQPTGTLDVPVFPYSMVVVPAGLGVESAIAEVILPLNGGASYMLVLYGTAALPQAALLSAPANAEASSAFVRFEHGIVGAPAVDIVVNETLVATLTDPLGESSTTRYMAVPPGTYSVSVRVSGTTQTLTSASLTAAAGERFTAAALGSAEEVAVSVFGDNLASLAPNRALLRVINGSGGPVSASLEDGTLIANNIGTGTASEIAALTPVSQSVIISGEGETFTSPVQSFYGGVLYDVLVVRGSDGLQALLPSPAALAQGIASAPGAEALSVAAAPTIEPTAAPAVVEAAQVATAAPTLPPAPTPVPVVVGIDENALIGRVFNLNPDANLHLRQYPNSSALSLGTVSFGTELRVRGREGAIADIPISSTRVPEDYEYVDPVALLENERADLDPATTWLYVTYNTPDGGQVDAWVRSDYVNVRTARGERVLLRNILTVPGNTPGEARNTGVTAPTGRQDIVTVVVTNLSANANLNVRRTPTNEAEVLAQLPLGTVAEFVGMSEDGEWVFLSFTGADGSTVTGWSSAEYLALQLNGAATTRSELEARGLMSITPGDERGEQVAGSRPVGQPTQDVVRDAIIATVVLDPGANLNLRRGPSEESEVIAQIPSGTRLVVSQRSGDANWLNVTFEGIEGWIAARKDRARFVELTFNSRPFDLLNVPIVEGDVDSARFTPTPTVPPTLTPVPAG